MNRRFDDSLFWKLIKAWPLVVSLLAVISAFAVMQTTLQAHSCALKENTVEHKEIINKVTRLEAIVDMLPEMRDDIKRLIRKNGSVK